jgi:hypothetical protein
MDLLSATTFKKIFSVDRNTFNSILENISPFIKVLDEVKAFNSSGGPVPLWTKLAVSLRWLAGGSNLDLCFAWGVAFSTFYHPTGVLRPTLEAINKAYSIGFPIVSLEELSRGFSEHSSGIMEGGLLAIDGFGVKTRQPSMTPFCLICCVPLFLTRHLLV